MRKQFEQFMLFLEMIPKRKKDTKNHKNKEKAINMLLTGCVKVDNTEAAFLINFHYQDAEFIKHLFGVTCQSYYRIKTLSKRVVKIIKTFKNGKTLTAMNKHSCLMGHVVTGSP